VWAVSVGDDDDDGGDGITAWGNRYRASCIFSMVFFNGVIQQEGRELGRQVIVHDWLWCNNCKLKWSTPGRWCYVIALSPSFDKVVVVLWV